MRIPYRPVTNKGAKAIKPLSIISEKQELEHLETGRNSSWQQRIGRVAGWLERQDRRLIQFIKNNRTKFLLDFFRKNSAAIVVVVATALIAAGNASSKEDSSGFLFGYFQKEVSNEEKIEQRVKSHAASNNLTTVPLVVASAPAPDENIQALLMNEEDSNQNQMQYQVLTATTPPDAKELLEGGADVAVYEVKEGDTISNIAQNFHVTVNTIMWANDIDDVDEIMPGDKIFVLPVTGVQHVVKDGETIDTIAKKYSADKERIIAFNELTADGAIQEGKELIIPDGSIAQPAASPTNTSPDNLLQPRNYYSTPGTGDMSGSREPSLIDRNPKGGHKFPYGYCTWYVATKKYVPWGGNAGTWLYHAKAYGAKTGKAPKAGAIIVTNESWYGHVAIVEKVSGDSVTISEMNYAGFAKKSTRTISSKSRVIKGYIY